MKNISSGLKKRKNLSNSLLRKGNLTSFTINDVVVLNYGGIMIINPDKDVRVCRTIKAQVRKNSLANFTHPDGTWGGTGVIMRIDENEK